MQVNRKGGNSDAQNYRHRATSRLYRHGHWRRPDAPAPASKPARSRRLSIHRGLAAPVFAAPQRDALVGSSTAVIGVILSAGNPDRLACSRISDSLGAW